MTNKELSKKLRCLRMHLSPLMTPENLSVLEEAERRLEKGGVSTTPAPSLLKDKKRQQGNRITKEQRYNKYFYN